MQGGREAWFYTNRSHLCMHGEEKKYTNLLFAAHLHSNVTSLISTKREIWNNVWYQMRGGRPLEENVDNHVLCYPANITAQPKCYSMASAARHEYWN